MERKDCNAKGGGLMAFYRLGQVRPAGETD